MANSARIIRSKKDIQDGVNSLKQSCEYMRRIYAVTGDPPLRRNQGGFKGLARIVVGQQLSVASANAIWSRLEMQIKPFKPDRFMAINNKQFRSLGLSRPKVRTLQAISQAVIDNQIHFRGFPRKSNETIKEQLVAIHGIGPWTADIYLMFCLGRADSWAPGDLALQYAVQAALQMEKKPDAEQLESLAEIWRPWRGVAARLLWAYYREIKNKNLGAPL